MRISSFLNADLLCCSGGRIKRNRIDISPTRQQAEQIQYD